METEPLKIEIVIREMPSYELLQEFLSGIVNGDAPRTVYFDYELGRFVRNEQL